MDVMTEMDRQTLINAIARREGTASQLAERFGYSVNYLVKFVNNNTDEIALRADHFAERPDDDVPSGTVTPTQLDELWITKKFERLLRYQNVCDRLYREAKTDNDPTILRELRSFMLAAANELGQLQHRGSGDAGTGDSLSVDIQGVDMEALR